MAENLDLGSLRLTLAVKHYRGSRLASRSDLLSQHHAAVVVSEQ